MKNYYGISIDGMAEDMYEWVQDAPNEGGASHFCTAKTKKELADGFAKAIKKYVMEHAYISDDYGYPKEETED